MSIAIDSRLFRNVARPSARWFLKLVGWRIHGAPPVSTPYIAIVAHHTSHWDAPLAAAFFLAQDLRVCWLGKQSLFRGPMNAALRHLGGIPVNRSHGRAAFVQAERVLRERPEYILVIFPEGTRRPRRFWKSGFYRLAQAVGAPIVPVGINFTEKALLWGPAIPVSSDITSMMHTIREFYEPIQGRFPDRATPVRLASERNHGIQQNA